MGASASVGPGDDRLNRGGMSGTVRTSTYATKTIVTMKKLVGSIS